MVSARNLFVRLFDRWYRRSLNASSDALPIIACPFLILTFIPCSSSSHDFFLSFTSPFVCLEINNLCTSTLNGDEGWPEVWPIGGMRRGRLSSGELLAGSLDICLSYIAGLSVTYRWYFMQSRLKGASSGVVGDGHWLGSLPGWYASICVKLLFLLAIFTLHFQFAFPLISSSYSISATLPWKSQHGYLSIDFNSQRENKR